MKQIKFLSILCAGFSLLTLNSCHNQDVEFPDYKYSAVNPENKEKLLKK